ETKTDSLGNGDARAAKDAAEQRAQVGLIPAAVGPGIFVLISPVTRHTAVETGELRQERKRPLLLAEILGFFAIKVIDTLAIDGQLPGGPLIRKKGSPIVGKLGASERVPRKHAG